MCLVEIILAGSLFLNGIMPESEIPVCKVYSPGAKTASFPYKPVPFPKTEFPMEKYALLPEDYSRLGENVYEKK